MNGRFNRGALPSVANVLRLLGRAASKANGSGYAQIRCPIHEEREPSMSIHLERGDGRCIACGASGRDALELYRRARSDSLLQAAHELGASESR